MANVLSKPFARATAALKATPGMVSYGASEATTHHLIASARTELPKDSTVVGLLPTTIDTPMNRTFMADADFPSWTKTEQIAQKIFEWSKMLRMLHVLRIQQDRITSAICSTRLGGMPPAAAINRAKSTWY
ncbi:hypothetical protein PsorP6_007333 [Peronosclerospora sorghi]|uniref:Uncharacterized protein n=1 Tax=Peronosclerospora sorghi TaxID=230839 RepID=A0ACC0W9B3_9STRA|nr:hypothetical protein PsorP6_007333 [Peronosclerospora sorghi]